jgi:hypothetical protein
MKRVNFCSLFLLLSVVGNVNAATYYVRTDGNDDADGKSHKTAWKTIDKVNRSVSDTSDKVYFQCGDKWIKEKLLIDWGGTAKNKATVGAYYLKNGKEFTEGCNQEKPIIDGKDVLPNKSFDALVKATKYHTLVENLRVLNSEGIGVRIFNCNYCEVYNVETDNSYRAGIQFYESNFGIAEGNQIREAGRSHPRVEGGKRWPANLSLVKSENILVRKNTVKESYGEGIGIYRSSNGAIIEDNILYANKSVCIYVDWSKDIIIRKNLCYGTTDSQYHRYQDIPYVGIGIKINDEYNTKGDHSENIEVYNNLVAYHNIGLSISTQHKDAKFKNNRIYHNTFVDNKFAVQVVDGPFENSFVQNNIFYAVSPDTYVYTGIKSFSGLKFNNNLWSSSISGSASGSGDIIGNPRLVKTDGWQSLKGGDLKPHDFMLRYDSPARDSGVKIFKISEDFLKKGRAVNDAPDIGAMEFTEG